MRERNWLFIFVGLLGNPLYAIAAFIQLAVFIFLNAFQRIGRMEKVHRLKTLRDYFEPVLSGKKRFEFRRNDRDFMEGDLLVLPEYDPFSGYMGREIGSDYNLPGMPSNLPLVRHPGDGRQNTSSDVMPSSAFTTGTRRSSPRRG